MDVLPQLAKALADRYALDKEIGRGGMATVYLARDVRSIVALRPPDRESQLVVVRDLGVEVRTRLEGTPR